VQALVAHGLSRQGRGWFEQRLGDNVKLEWYVYNAGPSAIEAIFAGTVAALVVQPDSTMRAAADFRGKRIATPQLGNTQDVAARAWLTSGGLRVTLSGGDVQVVPTDNPDQLALFRSRQIDAVWTVEPWVSRLELEANGKVLLEEKDAITTVVVSSRKLLDRQRDLVRRFVAAHAELTDWIRAHPTEAQAIVHDELATETHTQVSPDLIAHAWNRIVLTNNISRAPLDSLVAKARQAGFLRSAPDLSRLVERP
jgi:NitT/TauT family transport system substrate-binding protein